MKIALISMEFERNTQSGAGVYAFGLAKALARQGIDVHVLAPSSVERKEALIPNLTVHWLKVRSSIGLRVPTFYWAVWRKLPKLIKLYDIELIHNNEFAGITVPRKLPIITTFHHPARFDFKNFRGLQRAFNIADQLFEKIAVRRSQSLISVSHATADFYAKTASRHKQALSIIPNGIDTTSFKPSTNNIKSKYDIRSDEMTIFVPGGARARRKGLVSLLPALAKVSEKVPIKCLVSGQPREHGWKEDLEKALSASSAKSHIILCGEVPYEKLPDYFSSADIIVFPSIFEGFGIPILDAMACGKAVVATKTGEAAYLVNTAGKDITGILVEPGDSDGLYQGIAKLIQNSSLRTRMGQNGLASVREHYDWKAVSRLTIAQYENLLGTKR